MKTLPTHFHSKEEYEEWLEEIADECEVPEFDDQHEDGESFSIDHVRDWVGDSPQLAHHPWDWSNLYKDVREYSDHGIPHMEIIIPTDDPFASAGDAVAMAVTEDLVQVVGKKLQAKGYEVIW